MKNLIEQIRIMVASAAKEDKDHIEIPLSQIDQLVGMIKDCYYEGACDGAMDSDVARKAMDHFSKGLQHDR